MTRSPRRLGPEPDCSLDGFFIVDSRVIDRRITCPFCAEVMTIVIDLSAGAQSYVEDCQVCCQPMQVTFDVDDDELTALQVDRAS